MRSRYGLAHNCCTKVCTLVIDDRLVFSRYSLSNYPKRVHHQNSDLRLVQLSDKSTGSTPRVTLAQSHTEVRAARHTDSHGDMGGYTGRSSLYYYIL